MSNPVEIVLIYQSLLGIYGDRGNAMVLLKRLHDLMRVLVQQLRELCMQDGARRCRGQFGAYGVIFQLYNLAPTLARDPRVPSSYGSLRFSSSRRMSATIASGGRPLRSRDASLNQSPASRSRPAV